jgi:hypothetical protein
VLGGSYRPGGNGLPGILAKDMATDMAMSLALSLAVNLSMVFRLDRSGAAPGPGPVCSNSGEEPGQGYNEGEHQDGTNLEE